MAARLQQTGGGHHNAEADAVESDGREGCCARGDGEERGSNGCCKAAAGDGSRKRAAGKNGTGGGADEEEKKEDPGFLVVEGPAGEKEGKKRPGQNDADACGHEAGVEEARYEP